MKQDIRFLFLIYRLHIVKKKKKKLTVDLLMEIFFFLSPLPC